MKFKRQGSEKPESSEKPKRSEPSEKQKKHNTQAMYKNDVKRIQKMKLQKIEKRACIKSSRKKQMPAENSL